MRHGTYGHTPLLAAAAYGNPTVAKVLLADGADPNIKDRYGNTPLDEMPGLAKIVKKIKAKKAGMKQPAQPKVATP